MRTIALFLLILSGGCAAGQIRSTLEELQGVVDDPSLESAVVNLVESDHSDGKWMCQALLVISSVVAAVPLAREQRAIAEAAMAAARAACPWVLQMVDVIPGVPSVSPPVPPP